MKRYILTLGEGVTHFFTRSDVKIRWDPILDGLLSAKPPVGPAGVVDCQVSGFLIT